MATGIDYSSLFSSLSWTGQPVVFHERAGKKVKLSENNTVASRVTPLWVWGYAVVCTSEPVSIGQMFKVTVKKTIDEWGGGLEIGLTRGNPKKSSLTKQQMFSWKSGHEDLLHIDWESVFYNGKPLCIRGFNTYNPTVGQSLGMLVTRQGDLHWFLDDKWRGVVHVDGYPLDKPMWGVADVCARCEQVTAEILTVSKYNQSSKQQVLEMGLIKPEQPQPHKHKAQPQPDQTVSEDLLQQLLQEQESLRQQVQRKDGQLQQVQQDLTRERQQVQSLTQTIQQLTQTIQQLTQSNEQNQLLKEQLTQSNRSLQQQLAQRNATISRLEDQLTQANQLRQQSVSSRELEFWQVSPEEVSIREDQILGRGGWGYVAKGTFRGTPVAVKRVYPEILRQATLERICREIRTMAQIRHPNLVLFIAAVLDEQTGPMIVIELLDMSLRAAYETNRIRANKRKIFGDVSSALVYLHRLREPIIHRDVNSANVLLASLPNDTWLAKLSDFGSANLAQHAITPGEGAILYTAPEAYPQPPTSPRPHLPQTTKIDVYSFGVVACEVVTGVFPETDKFSDLLSSVSRVWPQIHPLITSCVSHSPQDRPTMDTVLSQIKQLDWEPN